MIEEIDSNQYIQHYFEKVYTEVGHSPEIFLRNALEFVEREAGLLSQPSAMDSLVRLAQEIADRRGGMPQESSPETKIVDAPAIKAPHPDSTATTSPPTASASMADADHDDHDGEHTSASPSSLLAINAGNGADLPTYSWTQTLSELIISIPVPPGTKGRDCSVSITRTHLSVGLKGSPSPCILSGEFPHPVKPDDGFWNLVDGKLLEITVAKVDTMQWWCSVVIGQPEIDPTQVEPEPSKLSDLDGEMRAQVEKMMFDQRQKALGLPTSDESAKQQAYEKFMKAHPELDFSDAKFM